MRYYTEIGAVWPNKAGCLALQSEFNFNAKSEGQADHGYAHLHSMLFGLTSGAESPSNRVVETCTSLCFCNIIFNCVRNMCKSA